MKKLYLLLLVSLATFAAQGQGFQTTVGTRISSDVALSCRLSVNPQNSYRLLLSTRNRGLQVSALKEFHRFQVFGKNTELTLIYGAGFHLGYEKWRENVYPSYWLYRRRLAPVVGLDALIGLEYNVWRSPFIIGVEAKPFFDLWGKFGFDFAPVDFAVTLRYNLN